MALWSQGISPLRQNLNYRRCIIGQRYHHSPAHRQKLIVFGVRSADVLAFRNFSFLAPALKGRCNGTDSMEWQPHWSWFRRKVISSLNVIFRGRLFVPSTSDPSNLITLSPWRHHRTIPHRDDTNYPQALEITGLLGRFGLFLLGVLQDERV